MHFECILKLSKLLGYSSAGFIIKGVWSKMRYSIGHSMSFLRWSGTILTCVTHSKYKLILNSQKCFDFEHYSAYKLSRVLFQSSACSLLM